MDAMLRDQWIAALRSGKYQQGRGSLRCVRADGTSRWCCLGVVLDVSGAGEWGGELPPPSRTMAYIMPNGSQSIYVLDHEVMEALGMPACQMDILVFMNDQQGRSFAEIAAWIEENL
jgi:hypothetical protein